MDSPAPAETRFFRVWCVSLRDGHTHADQWCPSTDQYVGTERGVHVGLRVGAFAQTEEQGADEQQMVAPPPAVQLLLPLVGACDHLLVWPDPDAADADKWFPRSIAAAHASTSTANRKKSRSSGGTSTGKPSRAEVLPRVLTEWWTHDVLIDASGKFLQGTGARRQSGRPKAGSSSSSSTPLEAGRVWLKPLPLSVLCPGGGTSAGKKEPGTKKRRGRAVLSEYKPLVMDNATDETPEAPDDGAEPVQSKDDNDEADDDVDDTNALRRTKQQHIDETGEAECVIDLDADDEDDGADHDVD